ncbi:MAG: tyrosine-protein phosphatase [Polyangiaceae bacterium]|nr:tyrosine-protein phosphatase [Polyangiaceae bacterium]
MRRLPLAFGILLVACSNEEPGPGTGDARSGGATGVEAIAGTSGSGGSGVASGGSDAVPVPSSGGSGGLPDRSWGGAGAAPTTSPAGAGGTATSSGGAVTWSGGTGGAASPRGGAAGASAGPASRGGPIDLGAAVVNARQVGGLGTAGGQHVRVDVLVRSGELSQVDCGRVQALGIATVIDLRDAIDAGATPDAACVTEDTRYFLADLPKILPPTPESYLQTLDAMEPELDAIFGELAREGSLPAVIHCVIGRDRASLTMALVLLALGVPEADVVLDFVENQATAGSTSAEWLGGVLARIEEAGGTEAYLGAHDVTADELAALRAQALE